MASNITYNGFTYEGDVAKEWYSDLLLTAPSTDLFNRMLNVKSKRQLPNINVSGISQEKSCTFTPGGDIDITTKQIEVETLDIGLTICEEDLESWWINVEMPAGSNNADFTPRQLSDIIMQQIKLKVSEEIELMLWQGDKAGGTATFLDLVDGLEVQLAADGTVIPVAAATLTSANIIAEIEKVIAVIPTTMLTRLGRPKVGIALSARALMLYRQALSNQFMNPAYVLPEVPMHNGVKLFQVNGISEDTMVFADFERVYFATDLMSDPDDIRILAMKDVTGDAEVRIVGRYKIGVAYPVGKEIVFYA